MKEVCQVDRGKRERLRGLADAPEPLLQLLLRVEAAPDPFIARDSVMCVECKVMGDCGGVLAKVLEQGDGESQRIWGRGGKWVLPLRGTLGLSRNRQCWVLKSFTLELLLPLSDGVTHPPLSPHVRKHAPSWADTSGYRWEGHASFLLHLSFLRTFSQ